MAYHPTISDEQTLLIVSVSRFGIADDLLATTFSNYVSITFSAEGIIVEFGM